jgi:hypothetical protein
MARTIVTTVTCDRCGDVVPEYAAREWTAVSTRFDPETGLWSSPGIGAFARGSYAPTEVRLELSTAPDLCNSCLRMAFDRMASVVPTMRKAPGVSL